MYYNCCLYIVTAAIEILLCFNDAGERNHHLNLPLISSLLLLAVLSAITLLIVLLAVCAYKQLVKSPRLT